MNPVAIEYMPNRFSEIKDFCLKEIQYFEISIIDIKISIMSENIANHFVESGIIQDRHKEDFMIFILQICGVK